jgi:ribonuclease HI
MSNIINKLSVFTDGSCLNNGKKNSTGAIGVFFSDDDDDNYGEAVENDEKITNQTMELLACIQAFRIIENKIANGLKVKMVYVYTDSTYLINCINKWYGQWVKNGWKNSKGKDVENKELIKVLYELKSKYIVIFKHVRSHQDEPDDPSTEEYSCWYGNFMADKLASDACREYERAKEIEKEKEEQKEIQQLIKIDNNEPTEIQEAIVKKVKKTKKTIKKNAKQSLNV